MTAQICAQFFCGFRWFHPPLTSHTSLADIIAGFLVQSSDFFSFLVIKITSNYKTHNSSNAGLEDKNILFIKVGSERFNFFI